MDYVSTRAAAPPVPLAEALSAGLAPDGGLYVPVRLARVDLAHLREEASLAEVAACVLAPFVHGTPLAAALEELCAEAYAPGAPLRVARALRDPVLELFHGPTAAFKDFGARFLAAALERLDGAECPRRTVLVATSGDTGAAVAAAFQGRPGARVVVLYPAGRVSARQAHQLGAFGGDVRAYAVDGSFDDCQRMVKRVLADPALRARHGATSANSISLGRLLPQVAYYAHAALDWWRAHGHPLGFVVPTGNLGNGVAAVWARALGAPVGTVAFATNANRVLADHLAGGELCPAPAVATVANAMDVGDPSNLERLAWTYRDVPAWRSLHPCVAFEDAAIRAEVARVWIEEGWVPCPHTATASLLRRRLRARGSREPLAVVATAHPAKFAEVVEPLVGHTLAVPAPLAELLARPTRATPLPAEPVALIEVLEADER